MTNVIFLNEDAVGKFDLTKADRISGGIASPILLGGDVITVRLAGSGVNPTQVLSTASSEVTVDDAPNGKISFLIAPAKSNLLKTGLGLPADITVTRSGKTWIYEFTNGVDVKAVAN
jgi:hypothetical protein